VSTIPDPMLEPVLTVERAGALFGLGRSKSYIEARRYVDTDGAEGLPAGAFGRTLRCPTAKVLELLGVHANGATNGNGADVHDGPVPLRE
jgi:hypothetical protein